MKTLDEVRARIKAKESSDLFGFARAVLQVHVPEGWKEGHEAEHLKHPLTQEYLLGAARGYLAFAFEKAVDHRGISAERSVHKLTEWMWLLGKDDAVAFCEDDSNYAQYGVPVLKHCAAILGVALPPEIVAWRDGEPCEPGCRMGCGQ